MIRRWLGSTLDLAFLENIGNEKLASFVRRPNQRPTGRVQEAHLVAHFFPMLKLLRGHVLADLEMSLGGLHVLAESETVHLVAPQVLHSAQDVIIRLAQAKHERGLGDDGRVVAFGFDEYIDGLLVVCSWVPYEPLKTLDCFDVVRVDVQARCGDDFDASVITAEIWRETFDVQLWTRFLDFAHCLSEVLRALVGQIVSVHRSYNYVVEIPGSYGLGCVHWFLDLKYPKKCN